MDTVLVAFAVVFVAELGDKTQLVALSLATRYRRALVLGGILLAFALTQAVGTAIGGALGSALPTTAIQWISGLLFCGFAAWTLLDREDEAVPMSSDRGSLWGVLGAMIVAEVGDKSFLAGATLAADRPPVAVWLGATLGETGASALAVLAGGWLGDRLPERATRIVAASLFALFGLLLLADAAF